MKGNGKYWLGGFVIAAVLSGLGWQAYVGYNESNAYYHTIAEIQNLKTEQLHHRMRVGGWVQAGTIAHLPGRVDFVLQEEGKTLPVSYVGSDPLPDTFKDGAQALVEGHQMPDGRFVAEQVQAKCASKYDASPNQGNPAGAPPAKSTDSSPAIPPPNQKS